MPENLDYSEPIKRIRKIVVISMFLIAASAILHILGKYIDDLMILSFILAVVGAFIYLLCLSLLLKRKEEAGVKDIIKKLIWVFIGLIIIYSIVFTT